MNWLYLLLEDTKYAPFKIWNVFSWIILVLATAVCLFYESLFNTLPVGVLNYVKLSFYISGINVVIHCFLLIYFTMKMKVNKQESFVYQTSVLKMKAVSISLYIVFFFVFFSLVVDVLFR